MSVEEARTILDPQQEENAVCRRTLQEGANEIEDVTHHGNVEVNGLDGERYSVQYRDEKGNLQTAEVDVVSNSAGHQPATSYFENGEEELYAAD